MRVVEEELHGRMVEAGAQQRLEGILLHGGLHAPRVVEGQQLVETLEAENREMIQPERQQRLMRLVGAVGHGQQARLDGLLHEATLGAVELLAPHLVVAHALARLAARPPRLPQGLQRAGHRQGGDARRHGRRQRAVAADAVFDIGARRPLRHAREIGGRGAEAEAPEHVARQRFAHGLVETDQCGRAGRRSRLTRGLRHAGQRHQRRQQQRQASTPPHRRLLPLN